jgi:hypothetical protein
MEPAVMTDDDLRLTVSRTFLAAAKYCEDLAQQLDKDERWVEAAVAHKIADDFIKAKNLALEIKQ